MAFIIPALALLFGLSAPNAEAAPSDRAPARILFVAPHPDDEVLGMGAEIWKAQRSSNVDYRIVIVTCGDAYPAALDAWIKKGQAKDLDGDGRIDYRDLGIARHDESLAALSSLGVPASKVIFLGYPDGGLDKFFPTATDAYRSPFTNTAAVPYSFAYHVGAPYRASSVIADLSKIISSFHATVVYSTTPTDEHLDHAQTRRFVSAALEQAGGKRTHLEYLIHWEQHVPTWPEASLAWSMPKGHVSPDSTVSLSGLGMPRDLKALAIRHYTTQVNVEGDYLEHFAKDSELFWRSRRTLAEYLVPKESAAPESLR